MLSCFRHQSKTLSLPFTQKLTKFQCFQEAIPKQNLALADSLVESESLSPLNDAETFSHAAVTDFHHNTPSAPPPTAESFFSKSSLQMLSKMSNLNVSSDTKRLLKNASFFEDFIKYTSRETYFQTIRPLEQAYSLIPDVYIDQNFLAVEQECVFKKSWVCVGLHDDVKNHGDAIATTIGNTPIIITNHKGDLHAFYNICRHRGSILLENGTYKNSTVIRCPYHCWTYSNKGKLLGTPFFNDNKVPLNRVERQNKESNTCGEFKRLNFDRNDFNLFEIKVKSFMSLIFVCLNKNEEDAEYLWNLQTHKLQSDYGNYPYQNMKCVFSQNYKINANWKLIAENFVEYYHLPFVHPELSEISSVKNHVLNEYDEVGQNLSFATTPLTCSGTPVDPYVFDHFDGLSQSNNVSAYFIHIFPNVSLFVFPHHIVSLITTPTNDANVTKEKMSVVMRDDVDVDDVDVQEKLGKMIEFYRIVNDQDIKAVEKCQSALGTCSDVYEGGMMSAKFEVLTYRFQNILVDYMTKAIQQSNS